MRKKLNYPFIYSLLTVLLIMACSKKESIRIQSIEVIEEVEKSDGEEATLSREELDNEFLKTRVDTLGFSTRTANALSIANIRTVGGVVRKTEKDLLALSGLGDKGVLEIKKAISNFGVTLKEGE